MTSFADLIARMRRGHQLDYDQCAWAMDQIMSGEVAPEVVAGFLTGLAVRGEGASEVRALADRMRAHALTPGLDTTDVLDIVGTGGDGLKTVNISTAAALVLAAAGIPVVKHGNRASTSACGSADVMEALGVKLPGTVDEVADTFKRLGITFIFANVFHPAMRFVAPVRRALGYPTVFNILGPLTNPACPRANAIGVSNAGAAPLMADVFSQRGCDALVFRSMNTGMDELTGLEPADVWEVHDGQVHHTTVDPARLGVARCRIDDLRGADAATNARIIRQVLEGQPGPVCDAIALNAAAGIVAYGRTPGATSGEGTLEQRMRAALDVARETIAQGRAANLLQDWVRLSAAA